MRAAATSLLAFAAALAIAGTAAALRYDDVQDEVGIDFTHTGSGQDGSTFLEVLGSGVCWGDVDGDGLPDAYFVNQRYKNATRNAERDPTSHLFMNDGDGTFTDESRARGVDHRGWAQGCSFADADGDGDLDLLVTGYDHYTFYRNQGHGYFRALPADESGITAEDKCPTRCWGTGSAWADYDRDGDLDVYVTNYVDFDIDNPGPISPEAYNGQPNVLFRNDGGVFTDVTAATNTSDDPGPTHSKAFQPVWFDHDGDGWLDIYIASDGTENSLLLNEAAPDGGRRFRDIAVQAGVNDIRSSMGLDINDEGGDGLPDLFFTHFEGQNNGFYVSRGDGTYRDRSGEGELGDDWPFVSWGTGFHDLDHDTLVDIYAVNGHAFPVDAIYLQHSQVWLQNPNGTYRNATDETGPGFLVRGIARGSGVADYDGDGDLDILVSNADDLEGRLLRSSEAGGHWLQVELRSSGPNTRGVGAWVEAVLPDGRVAWRWTKAGNSYMSQDWEVVHVGLGNFTAVADLVVRWPDGEVQRVGPLAADQRVRVTKGEAGVLNDTLSPRTTLTPTGPRGDAGWYQGAVRVAIAARDLGVSNVSGVVATEFRVGGGAWAAAPPSVRLTEEGVHVVEARSRDAAGNVEPVRRLEVRIDRTPPFTRATFDGDGGPVWYRGPVRVTLTATDPVSGVRATVVRFPEGPWKPLREFTIDTPGIHHFQYRSGDVAGNLEVVRDALLRIDPEPPVVAAAGAGVAVVAGARDLTSGIARVEFYVAGEAAPRHVAMGGGPHVWSIIGAGLPPGPHVVRVVAVDHAGHVAETPALVVAPPPAALPLGGEDVAAEARRAQVRRTISMLTESGTWMRIS